MGQKDDFKNFFIIKKMEEDINNKTLLEALWKNKFKIFIFIFVIIFIVFLYKILLSPVGDVKSIDEYFQINNKESVNYIADELKEKEIIRSTFAFRIYMKLSFGKDIAHVGIYKFSKNDNLISIANKIKNSDYAISPIKITIPEGSDNNKIAIIISQAFSSVDPQFKKDDFSVYNILSSIQNQQTYLFPETYFFLPNASLNQVILEMKKQSYENLKNLFVDLKDNKNNVKVYDLDLNKLNIDNFFDDSNQSINFNKKLTVVNDLGTTTLSLQNILTMASYLEGEANNNKDMRIVSGVLWTRIKIGYYLQIDAASSTYKIKGFTKSPINNPGLVAINAALNPTQTGYLYYITGRDGEMYYAKDYETHLVNIKRHLR